jgi:hypothetical protein
MKRKSSGKTDPMEPRIEAALDLGADISEGECFSFVHHLDRVVASIRELTKTEPARAAALYERFLAGCYAKANEVDDSSGEFGQFVGELICAWLPARQASGASADETAAMLLARMEDDNYGFCVGIENDVPKALDRAGLAAWEKQVRARYDAAAKPAPGTLPQLPPDYLRRQWSGVLRAIYLKQTNVAAYVALAAETGLRAEDCLAVGTMLSARRKPEDALAWVKRGLTINRATPHQYAARFKLDRLKRELSAKLGAGSKRTGKT